jgi:hypothetical protein
MPRQLQRSTAQDRTVSRAQTDRTPTTERLADECRRTSCYVQTDNGLRRDVRRDYHRIGDIRLPHNVDNYQRPLTLNLSKEDADVALVQVAQYGSSRRWIVPALMMHMVAATMNVRDNLANLAMMVGGNQLVQTVTEQGHATIQREQSSGQQFSA